MKKNFLHLNIKKCLFLSCLLLPLVACNNGSQNKGDQDQIIYTDEVSYDYKLVDDETYGTAIYPNVAYRTLREIKAYNRQREMEWPSEGYRGKYRSYVAKKGGAYSTLTENLETYMKDEYYQIKSSSFSLEDGDTDIMVDEDTFYLEDDCYYHESFVSGEGEDPLVTPSSLQEMDGYRVIHTEMDELYDHFVDVVNSIQKEQLQNIVNPQQIKCYTKGEGSLYISIVRNHIINDNVPYRLIYRIIFDNYMPVLAVNNKVTSILANDDYCNEVDMATFTYDVEEIRGEINE